MTEASGTEHRDAEHPRPCPPDRPCQFYWPGHHMHVIHANKVGESPWGWRGGAVVAIDAGGTIIVDYDDHTGVRVWHHEDLTAEVEVGYRVAVHEGWHAFNFGEHLVNVVITDGLGAVPTPEDTDAWSERTQRGIVSMDTGRGLAVGRNLSDEEIAELFAGGPGVGDLE